MKLKITRHAVDRYAERIFKNENPPVFLMNIINTRIKEVENDSNWNHDYLNSGTFNLGSNVCIVVIENTVITTILNETKVTKKKRYLGTKEDNSQRKRRLKQAGKFKGKSSRAKSRD